MKKIFRKISYGLSIFVLGAQSRIFARDRSVTLYGPAPDPGASANTTIFDPGQTDIYGPAPDPGSNSVIHSMNSIDQPAIYGPAPDPIRNATGLGPGQILSIIVTLILFMLGIMVALNKGIKKNVKIISLSIISVVIVILILLTIFVF